jgi:hypothetical protein
MVETFESSPLRNRSLRLGGPDPTLIVPEDKARFVGEVDPGQSARVCQHLLGKRDASVNMVLSQLLCVVRRFVTKPHQFSLAGDGAEVD